MATLEITHTHQPPQATAANPSVEKMRLQIAELRWRVGRIYKVAQIVSIVSGLIAVFAFLIGLRQFNTQQDQEVKKPIREKQLELVLELSGVASKIATLKPDDVDRKTAENRFWELYWGPVVYIEDAGLETWLADFRKCLEQYHQAQALELDARGPTQPEGCYTLVQQENRLKRLSLELAVMRRNQLGLEWDIKFEDIRESRAQNIPTPSILP